MYLPLIASIFLIIAIVCFLNLTPQQISQDITWSNSLSFTVERSGKTLVGSAASGEGLVNVFRGSGKVLLAPVDKAITYTMN